MNIIVYNIFINLSIISHISLLLLKAYNYILIIIIRIFALILYSSIYLII